MIRNGSKELACLQKGNPDELAEGAFFQVDVRKINKMAIF
jgi:hypothetical protein